MIVVIYLFRASWFTQLINFYLKVLTYLILSCLEEAYNGIKVSIAIDMSRKMFVVNVIDAIEVFRHT